MCAVLVLHLNNIRGRQVDLSGLGNDGNRLDDLVRAIVDIGVAVYCDGGGGHC